MSTFVFINGQYRADLSDSADLLRYAEIEAGELTLRLPKNFYAEDPIYWQHINTEPGSHSYKHMVFADENSQAIILESYKAKDANAYSNTVETQIHLKANACLDYYKWQCEGAHANHESRLIATQACDSCFRTYHIVTGAQSSHDQLSYALTGKNATCESIGFFRTHEKQQTQIESQIYHSGSHTNSRQLYKGMANDQSRGAFYGKIVVDPNIKDICAHQKNNNLLLSSLSEIDTKPELEIYSDDVQCTHGATVGQLDAEALFYLRSRGLVEAEAKRLLTYAFVNEVLDALPHSDIALKIRGTVAV